MLDISTKVKSLETPNYSFSRSTPRRWFLDWPLYIILAISAFFHFFRIQTTEFDFDQANLFQLAHDAIAHGLIPLSSNQASIGVLHAPFFIYTLLPAAALSSNPLGGAITVALFTTVAAAFAYWFTYRYFGRLPAIVAGLLNATAYVPLKYSNSIWQPDILPFFMILFLFVIFRGAVERRKGWFFPAVALMAITYQIHPSSIVGVGALLIVTLILAPTTVRWRDIFLAAGALIVLFFPYASLEMTDHFADLQGLLAFAHQPAHNDIQALSFYRDLILPFNEVQPAWMTLLGWCIQLLLLAGLMTAIVRLFQPPQREYVFTEEQREVSNRWLQLWNKLRFNPGRVSCLLLLVWQIIPFANLLHHSVDLHMQYLLLFLPGPFILIGLSLDEFVRLIKRLRPNLIRVAQIGTVLLSILLVIGQFVSSTAYIFKMREGHFNDRTVQNLPYVNDLNSMWNAVHQADQLAQKMHISRIYMSMDTNIQPSMSYLGEILHTPTTVFGYENCLVLPAAEAGPAVYLVGPYADHIDTMLHQFASVKLVAQPQRLGGRPFKLYIVTPKAPAAMTTPSKNGTASLQLLDQNIHPMTGQNGNMELTRWSIQREAPIAPRTLYNYQLSITPTKGAKPITMTCATTALHKNDQLLATFQLSKDEKVSSQQSVGGIAYDRVPDVYRFGSIQVTSFNTQAINVRSLKSTDLSPK
jgi:hypothetical protein